MISNNPPAPSPWAGEIYRKEESDEIHRYREESGRTGPGRTLGIEEKDPLEIYMDGPSIVLRKYQVSCVFCDSEKDIFSFRGKNVCRKCAAGLQLLSQSDLE